MRQLRPFSVLPYGKHWTRSSFWSCRTRCLPQPWDWVPVGHVPITVQSAVSRVKAGSRDILPFPQRASGLTKWLLVRRYFSLPGFKPSALHSPCSQQLHGEGTIVALFLCPLKPHSGITPKGSRETWFSSIRGPERCGYIWDHSQFHQELRLCPRSQSQPP